MSPLDPSTTFSASRASRWPGTTCAATAPLTLAAANEVPAQQAKPPANVAVARCVGCRLPRELSRTGLVRNVLSTCSPGAITSTHGSLGLNGARCRLPLATVPAVTATTSSKAAGHIGVFGVRPFAALCTPPWLPAVGVTAERQVQDVDARAHEVSYGLRDVPDPSEFFGVKHGPHVELRPWRSVEDQPGGESRVALRGQQRRLARGWIFDQVSCRCEVSAREPRVWVQPRVKQTDPHPVARPGGSCRPRRWGRAVSRA